MTEPCKGRILFINRVFPMDAGPSGLRLLELAQGLAAAHWRVTILCGAGRGDIPTNLHHNIDVVRITLGAHEEKPRWWHYPAWYAAFFWRACRLPRPDIVVTLTDPPLLSVVSALLKKTRGVGAVHWVHDLYPHLLGAMGVRLPFLMPALKKMALWSHRAHDDVVVLGDDMAAVLKADGVPDEKVATIMNWPDVEWALIDRRKPAHHDSKNPFVLEGCFTVLYSGNFGAMHEFGPLVDAIKIVHQSPHPIRFILAGEGSQFATVRDTVERMALTNVHVIRTQPKDKFLDMLLAGDVHIASMIPESLGLIAPSKINSSLGLGRPCIVMGSPRASQAQLVASYKAGLVVDPSDPQARFKIAEAIIRYATDKAEYDQACGNAMRAAEQISFENGVEKFDALFETFLKK
jgi:colanic acid biosynthesis glycosyl transferase WcaI